MITRLRYIFIRNHYSQHILANKMFLYSYSIKIQALRLDKHLESVFCLLLVLEIFSLHKVVRMLEQVVVGWREVT